MAFLVAAVIPFAAAKEPTPSNKAPDNTPNNSNDPPGGPSLWSLHRRAGDHWILAVNPAENPGGILPDFLETAGGHFSHTNYRAGPRFNATSCGPCHDNPMLLGRGDKQLTVTLYLKPGQSSPAKLLKFAHGGVVPMTIPKEAIAHAERLPTPLYFDGVLDRIPESWITGQEKLQSGRATAGHVNRTPSGALGRFGAKSSEPTLASQVLGAITTEMQISHGPTLTVQSLPDSDGDGILEPELADDEILPMLVYARRAGAPFRYPADPRWQSGRGVFEKIGCADCHVPSLGKLPEGPAVLYSDLLLHDMGPAMSDGLPTYRAGASEYRTAPLVGMAGGGPYLHDGRAATVSEAILDHGGQGDKSASAFRALDDHDRSDLLAFVDSIVPWSLDPTTPWPYGRKLVQLIPNDPSPKR